MLLEHNCMENKMSNSIKTIFLVLGLLLTLLGIVIAVSPIGLWGLFVSSLGLLVVFKGATMSSKKLLKEQKVITEEKEIDSDVNDEEEENEEDKSNGTENDEEIEENKEGDENNNELDEEDESEENDLEETKNYEEETPKR